MNAHPLDRWLAHAERALRADGMTGRRAYAAICRHLARALKLPADLWLDGPDIPGRVDLPPLPHARRGPLRSRLRAVLSRGIQSGTRAVLHTRTHRPPRRRVDADRPRRPRARPHLRCRNLPDARRRTGSASTRHRSGPGARGPVSAEHWHSIHQAPERCSAPTCSDSHFPPTERTTSSGQPALLRPHHRPRHLVALPARARTSAGPERHSCFWRPMHASGPAVVWVWCSRGRW